MKFVFLGLLLGALPALADPLILPESERDSLHLAVYEQDRGLVEDSRWVDASKGEKTIEFESVSNFIIPESVQVDFKEGSVLEQNYKYDVLSREALLRYLTGETVGVLRTNPQTGEVFAEKGILLASSERYHPLVKIKDRIESPSADKIVFYDIPKGLKEKPTLSFKTDIQTSALRVPFKITYLTQGLSFDTNYVGQLAKDDKSLILSGDVSIYNNTDTPFKKAKISLVSGKVHFSSPSLNSRMVVREMDVKESRGFESRAPVLEKISDYTVYHLQGEQTLLPMEKKQISLFKNKEIPVQKFYRYENLVSTYPQTTFRQKENQNPEMVLLFKNEKIGQATLPKGKLRLYQKKKGTSLFIGEDTLQALALGQEGKINFGTSVDVYAEAKRTSFQQIGKNFYELSFEITLHNTKESSVQVEVRQFIPYSWKIGAESLTSKKVDANTVEWEVSLLKKETKTLTFKIEIQKK
ncbi:MAG: DUF4139 domain-containing protein [Alphaproteobacteria bacterium]|nr:DUF4139 domain-containing protein [Alphaproteobacteria bacterium]